MDIQIVTVERMRRMLQGSAFDDATREALFEGRTTLQKGHAVFKVDPKEAAKARQVKAAQQVGPKDLGDKVMELMAAANEGREPAEWARTVEANEPETVGDMGDKVAALMAAEKEQEK